LEPTPENNIKVTIVDPRVWKEVLAAREKIRNNPTQEDHLKLARAINQALSGIKGFMREDPAGKPMFDEAIESLDKAGESVEAYTLRAEMLFKCEIVGICPKSDHAKAVEYLKKAFAIDPEYQPAIELAWGFSTEDIIPTVQPAQPEENPTEEAETPGLGEVQSQAGTQVPGSGQEDQPGAKNPLCGSLGLIPLALIVPTIKYAKRQSRH
jgi:hypothetical protein